MDTERVAPTTSAVHVTLDQDNSTRTIQTDPFTSFYPNLPRTTAARLDSDPLSSTSSEKLEINETSSMQPLRSTVDNHTQPILHEPNSEERETKTNNNEQVGNGVDWRVPNNEKGGGLTVGERLQPTLDNAIIEKNKYSSKAQWSGYALNFAIGLQVLLGSLTTGLSALSVSGGRSTAKATTALGALATLVASYLARVRGSNEPELSITRTKDLEQFIRECRSFQLDQGHILGNDLDEQLIGFRHKFEELLGNANGERKLSSV